LQELFHLRPVEKVQPLTATSSDQSFGNVKNTDIRLSIGMRTCWRQFVSFAPSAWRDRVEHGVLRRRAHSYRIGPVTFGNIAGRTLDDRSGLAHAAAASQSMQGVKMRIESRHLSTGAIPSWPPASTPRPSHHTNLPSQAMLLGRRKRGGTAATDNASAPILEAAA
jgi:hypothetical protein